MSEVLEKKLITLTGLAYEGIYMKIGNGSNFSFSPSNSETTSLKKFIGFIDKKYGLNGIGANFIFEYFIFQLDYWHGLETRFGKKIPLSWFIGLKAFDRWVNRIEHDLFHAYKTAREYGISKNILKEKNKPFDYLSVKEYEEVEKNRFYGEIDGLLNCIETTSMFNKSSKLCIDCKWKDVCKKNLKKEYPKVYILRGLLKDEKNGAEK